MTARLVRVVLDVWGVGLDVSEALSCLGFVGARDEYLNALQLQLWVPSSGTLLGHDCPQAAAAQHADDQLRLRATGYDGHAHRLALVFERRARVVRLLAFHVSLYGTRTVRSPGASSRVQACSTSANGTVFETDVVTMLERLLARDREALSRLVSRLLAAQAAEQGIDLFPAAGLAN
jgi:hypothetical protein